MMTGRRGRRLALELAGVVAMLGVAAGPGPGPGVPGPGRGPGSGVPALHAVDRGGRGDDSGPSTGASRTGTEHTEPFMRVNGLFDSTILVFTTYKLVHPN